MRANLVKATLAAAIALGACGDDGKKTGSDSATDASTTLETSFGDVTQPTETDTGAPTETTETDTSVPTEVADDVDATEPTEVADDVDTSVPTEVADADASEPTDVPTSNDTEVVVTPPSGERCDDAFLVTVPAGFGAPIVVDGDTTGAADDHAVAEGACPGLGWALGDGAPDEVWSFTAPSAGSYQITLRADTADLGFYVLTGCSASADGSCVRGADTIGDGVDALDSTKVVLSAGQTVSVVVDSFVDESTPASFGAYELVFDPRRPAPLGEDCGSAIVLQPGPGGYVGSGDNGTTSALNDDYHALACAEFFDGFGVADQVWKFTAPSTGNWDVTVTPSGAADPMVYFHRNAACNDTCSGFVDDLGDGGAEQATVVLTAGESIYIVVDAFQVEAGGQYILKVVQGCVPNACTLGSCADDGCGQRCPCAAGLDCNTTTNQCVCTPDCSGNVCNVDDGCNGTCACGPNQECNGQSQCVTPVPGDTCADAQPLTSLGGAAFSGAGDLDADRDDDLATGACPTLGGFPPSGSGTPDEVWSFVIAAAGTYRVSVDSATGVDAYFMLYSNASCTTCVGANDNAATGGEDTIELQLAAGSYKLAVDARTTALAGAYTISVTPVGDVPVTGDGCELPYALTAGAPGTWTGSGNLSLVDQDVDDDDEFEVGSCAIIGTGTLPADGVDTEDEVFALDVPTSGNYRITVTPEDGDVFVQILAGDSCDAASCLGYRDAAGYDQAEVVTLSLDAQATHYIVVDTYLTGEAGAFTVLVESVCTPQCTAGSCADDGCGTPCACGTGEQCVSGLCADRAGGSCADPFTLTADVDGALVGSGDLSGEGAEDDFDQLTCPDLGTSFDPAGDGTDDEVFAFSVASSGTYRVTVTPLETDFDLMWGLQSGATCATSTCVGYLDEAELAAESADVALTAGTSYWLVVEPYAFTNPGAYSVSVALVPAGVVGETCASPLTFVDLGVPVVGTTTVAVDDLNGLQCGGAGITNNNLGDVVYRLDAPYQGQYTFTLTPSGGADLSLYSFSADTGTCNTFNCLDGSDVSGGDGVETIDVTVNQGASAYIVIDGEAVAGQFSLATATTAVNCATDLFFSEYIEGSSNNKGLEIFNGTGQTVDLTRYTVRVQQNGTTGAVGTYRTLPLTGSLAAGATYTLCNSGLVDQTCDFEDATSVVQFNGNDSIALLKDGVVIELFGIDGVNPGTSWPVGSGSTIDHTLVRKPAVSSPSALWDVEEWIVLDSNVFSGFDAHPYFWACPATP